MILSVTLVTSISIAVIPTLDVRRVTVASCGDCPEIIRRDALESKLDHILHNYE